MASFCLLAATDEEREDELLLLLCYKDNSNSGDAFNFDELSAEACKKLFRFEKDDIPNLCTALGIPDSFEYANAVAARDAPLLNCWHFINGSVRPLCRPTTIQRILFNGHKRVHAIKFQSIVALNGLVANMYGRIEVRNHDAGLLRESSICEELQTYMTTPADYIYVIYGDPAYPMTTHIIKPF
ncbi:unnamed protein product [Mytilus coruscus]|uniref:DDE Tnp4 domain-containing protein n=1 Tax=Mytilus coruscus TaxID=42192 RepID=A0A6J8AVS2_MYTCO|nr:unnamed protein product [Mytilus coruscus]